MALEDVKDVMGLGAEWAVHTLQKSCSMIQMDMERKSKEDCQSPVYRRQ